MKVLIADDDLFTRMLLKETLQSLGHEVVEAENGIQAWEIYQQQSFPLVISDWVMPAMDGLELCRRIREKEQDTYTYIIMLTVMEGKENFLEGIRAGIDDFVSKPFDKDIIMARLHVAMRILDLLAKNRQLQALIPICMYCRKARNDQNYWQQLDEYLAQQTDAQLSHGICPDCMRTHHPEVFESMTRDDRLQ